MTRVAAERRRNTVHAPTIPPSGTYVGFLHLLIDVINVAADDSIHVLFACVVYMCCIHVLYACVADIWRRATQNTMPPWPTPTGFRVR
jgi:hypothetical protein